MVPKVLLDPFHPPVLVLQKDLAVLVSIVPAGLEVLEDPLSDLLAALSRWLRRCLSLLIRICFYLVFHLNLLVLEDQFFPFDQVYLDNPVVPALLVVLVLLVGLEHRQLLAHLEILEIPEDRDGFALWSRSLSEVK